MKKNGLGILLIVLTICLLTGCAGNVTEVGDSSQTESSQIENNQAEDSQPDENQTGSGGEEDSATSGDEETESSTESDLGDSNENQNTEPVIETITISATGDCALGALQTHGYSRSFHEYYDKYGETYFFEKFQEIFAQDDITIVNLECVFTDETKRVEKTFNIKGYPHYAGILSSSSIEVCSLANNHTKDYGDASFEDTKEALESVGVSYAYEDIVAYYETESGIRVAMLSAYLLSQRAVKEPILMEALETARKEADLVIVSCHWGDENKYVVNDYQQETAHKLIDAGADLIIGHHPHRLQGVEYYKGKVICYSLGNFSFGANRNPEDKNTVVYQQTFTFVDGELSTDVDARIIPSRLSGKNNLNNYQPIIATGEQAAEIIDKMNEYSSSVGKITFDEEGNLITNE